MQPDELRTSSRAKPQPEPKAPPSAADLVRRNVARMRKMEDWSKRQRTFADRVAEAVARFCGQFSFVWIHALLFVGWIAWNELPGLTHFDPYPFTFLTLCVSLEAIFLSAFILISQNYEMRLTERRSQLDLQINLLAEQENTKALALLQLIARKLGALENDDPEVQALAEAVRPETIGALIEDAYREAHKGHRAPPHGRSF